MTWIQGIAATAVSFVLAMPVVGHARTAGPDCNAVQQRVRAEIDAACPCDSAPVHAEYVRCVTKKLRDLTACTPGADGKRSCGPLPRMCAGKIRRVASRSACGKPETTVTCCIPKQQDCAGDASPGDGKADGTCTGSTRKCDRVSECMIPKCEMAAGPERCRLLGGTIGNGRDCSSACPQ